MYEKLARLIFDYTVHDKNPDKAFVEKAISIIVDERDLSDFVLDTTIYDKKIYNNNEYITNDYNMTGKTLNIYLPDDVNRPFERLIYRNNIVLVNCINVISSIAHELDHTLIRKSIDEGDCGLDVELTKLLLDIEKPRLVSLSDEEYDKCTQEEKNKLQLEAFRYTMLMGKRTLNYMIYHDEAPFERRAIIDSSIDVSNTIKELYDTSIPDKAINTVNEKELRYLIKRCRAGYKVKGEITNAPSFDYFDKVFMNDKLKDVDIYDKDIESLYVNANDFYTLQERVLYGLPLTKEEYKDINMDHNPFNAFGRKAR